MSKIYRVHNFGLGDAVGTLNYLNFIRNTHSAEVVLSTTSHGVDMSYRLDQLVETMMYPISLTREEPNIKIDGYYIWSAPSFQVQDHLRWTSGYVERTVTYQFDGDSSAEDKNPSQAEVQAILDHISALGFKPVKMDRSLDLCEATETVSNSAMFVGCDSGFSHIAHLTGTPCYLYEKNLPIITCHRQKQFVRFRSVEDFKGQSRMYFELFNEGIHI